MFNRFQRDEEGFTLIELLVVVIIIGILAAIAIPTFLNQRQNGWTAAAESDVRNAALEIEAVATANNGTYPAALPAGVQTSPDVTLTYTQQGAIAGQAFCVSATHAQLAGVVAAYDSDGGGLMDTPTANCT